MRVSNLTAVPDRVRGIFGQRGLNDANRAAQALDVSVRSLQRELNTAGRSFREIVREARTRRAMELQRDERLSVATISDALCSVVRLRVPRGP